MEYGLYTLGTGEPQKGFKYENETIRFSLWNSHQGIEESGPQKAQAERPSKGFFNGIKLEVNGGLETRYRGWKKNTQI